VSDTRKRNLNWNVGEKITEWNQCNLAVLMDIREELQAIRRLGECYRVARGFDAMIELAAEARRKKQAAEKKRKSKAVR